jgi:chemotaxis signal transduction protein
MGVSGRLPVPRVRFRDAEVLEARARALAGGAAAEGGGARPLRVVTFRLRGRACAVDASAVERAVVLASPFGVPLADGSERPVAFVEERPVPVADLAGATAGAPRRTEELAGAPALVVATPGGPVAVAVQGPLDLAEEALREAAPADGEPEGEGLRVAGRLAGGAALLDAAWLGAWARKAASP